MRSSSRRRALAALLAAAVTVPLAAVPAAAQPAGDVTSADEALRVDRVPTPVLEWYPCFGLGECTTVRLPLDYDRPGGRQTELAIARVPASDPANRIGSLFVNPGGPGGSGVEMALVARAFLPADVVARFDIVGFDPRGIGFSDNVRCFRDLATQGRVLAPLLDVVFPYTPPEEQAYVGASRDLGRACARTGTPLSASMSTAQVARDMDVLRRAVGDQRLSYLGFSYGSYLGQVYANLFPDRVRAVVIDGVLDPVAWAGTPRTADQAQTDRLRSADGSWKALHEILRRCDRVGRRVCRFAPGDPVKNLALIAERLTANPLVTEDPLFGPIVFGYDDLVGTLLGMLYDPFGYQYITDLLADLMIATAPPAPAGSRAAAAQDAARQAVTATVVQARAGSDRPPYAFPYDNGLEAFSSVLCTDGLNPADAAAWPPIGAAADERAPYFGRLWAWSSSPCATSTWTARDEDAYRGPFTGSTSAPVLVIGNFWDPATNYDGAVAASTLLPASRLLSSDSWGHTAFGSSACVNDSVSQYLLDQMLPPEGTTCRGDVQPFEPLTESARATARPPVVPFVPPGVPGPRGFGGEAAASR